MFKNKFEKHENRLFDTTALKLFLVISAISLAVLNATASTTNLDNLLNIKWNNVHQTCPTPYKYESCNSRPSSKYVCESGKNKFMRTFIMPESLGTNTNQVCTQGDAILNSTHES
jgi:hypothetical protein